MECSEQISKCVLFPCSCQKLKGTFFQSLPWEPSAGLLEVKLIEVCGPNLELTLVCPHWASNNWSIKIFLPITGLNEGFLLQSAVILYICLHFWGWYFALWPHFLDRPKKRFWLLVCSALFLLWGQRWWLTSSSHTALDCYDFSRRCHKSEKCPLIQ